VPNHKISLSNHKTHFTQIQLTSHSIFTTLRSNLVLMAEPQTINLASSIKSNLTPHSSFTTWRTKFGPNGRNQTINLASSINSNLTPHSSFTTLTTESGPNGRDQRPARIREGQILLHTKLLCPISNPLYTSSPNITFNFHNLEVKPGPNGRNQTINLASSIKLNPTPHSSFTT
jgi:hypothetical protein